MTTTNINSLINCLADILTKNNINNEHLKTLVINNNFFNDKYIKDVNITLCDEHKDTFEKLFNLKQPVLYWFEFDTSFVTKKILRIKYENYRNSIKTNYTAENYRNTSALKADYSKSEKTLYVGKVKTGFWGRFVTHLGYNKTVGTAGMQLHHWYEPELYGNLTLNYIVFSKEMENLITVLEMELALQLNPIIGKY